MISDVLYDAIQEITTYQAEDPHAYEQTRPIIDDLLNRMRIVQDLFDAPPDSPRFEQALLVAQQAAGLA